MKHIIIGAGAAAISAVKRIRKEKPEDNIVIISQDEKVYSRCMLHKVISGERSEENINFVNDDLFNAPNITWIKGKTVTKLDPKSKAVYAGEEKLDTGDTILIATGANSVIPPIGELKTAKNVFGLRHLHDVRAIIKNIKEAEKIAVIGGGLVGLDAVYGILEAGAEKKIDVIEMAPRLLAINLDDKAAESYQKLFEQRGVKFHLSRKMVNTKSTGDNISSLELDDGTIIDCDMVIVAVGVSPASAFTTDIELTERRAIKVNEYLETSIPGIYAAGDAAGLSGIWPNAKKQGDIAAYNMTGTKWAYDDLFAFKTTINFFNLLSLSLGIISPQEGDEVLVKEDRENYRRLILREGTPVGIILQGEIGGSGFWQHLIKNSIPISNICSITGKSPWKISYADFFGLEENGEYKWMTIQ